MKLSSYLRTVFWALSIVALSAYFASTASAATASINIINSWQQPAPFSFYSYNAQVHITGTYTLPPDWVGTIYIHQDGIQLPQTLTISNLGGVNPKTAGFDINIGAQPSIPSPHQIQLETFAGESCYILGSCEGTETNNGDEWIEKRSYTASAAPDPVISISYDANGTLPVNNPAIFFSNIQVNTTDTRTLYVRNIGGGTVVGAASIAGGEDPFFCLPSCSYSIVAGAPAIPIQIQYAPGSIGLDSPAILNFSCTSANCSQVNVNLRGTSVPSALTPQISLSAGSMNFGTVNLGAQLDKTITINNVGGGILVGAITLSRGEYTCEPSCNYGVPSGGSQTIVIRYTPSSPGGNQDASAVFSGGLSPVSIPLFGSSLDHPIIQINCVACSSSNSWVSGPIAPGQSVFQNVEVRNIGAGILNGRLDPTPGNWITTDEWHCVSVTQNGVTTAFDDATPCSFSGLTNGGPPAIVTMEFRPSTAGFIGSRYNSVNFINTVYPGNLATLGLTGIVTISPTLQVNGNLATGGYTNFGDTILGTPITRSLVLTNIGTAPLTAKIALPSGAGVFTCVNPALCNSDINIGAGNSITVTFTFDPTLATDYYQSYGICVGTVCNGTFAMIGQGQDPKLSVYTTIPGGENTDAFTLCIYEPWECYLPAIPGGAPLPTIPPLTVNIGEADVTPLDDNGNANLLVAQNAALGQTATIQSLSFYVTNAAGNLRLGIYDATGPGGGPGTKKAETNSFVPIVGWNTAPVITPVSLPAGLYWITYLSDNNALGFRKNVTSGVSGRYYPYPFAAMPATYSSGPAVLISPSHWSLYATFNTVAIPTHVDDVFFGDGPNFTSATAVAGSFINCSYYSANPQFPFDPAFGISNHCWTPNTFGGTKMGQQTWTRLTLKNSGVGGDVAWRIMPSAHFTCPLGCSGVIHNNNKMGGAYMYANIYFKPTNIGFVSEDVVVEYHYYASQYYGTPTDCPGNGQWCHSQHFTFTGTGLASPPVIKMWPPTFSVTNVGGNSSSMGFMMNTGAEDAHDVSIVYVDGNFECTTDCGPYDLGNFTTNPIFGYYKQPTFKFTPTVAGVNVGHFVINLSNGASVPFTISGNGNILPVISIAPVSGFVPFGTVNQGYQARSGQGGVPTITVTNTGGGFLTGDAILSDTSNYHCIVCHYEALAPGVSQEIQVAFVPQNVGTLNTTLTLTGGGGGVIDLLGAGALGASVINSPDANFGKVVLRHGNFKEQLVTIRNLGSIDVPGGTITLSGPFTCVPPTPTDTVTGLCTYPNIAPGGTAQFTIRFTPVVQGLATGLLTLSGSSNAKVRLTGIGVSPSVKFIEK